MIILENSETCFQWFPKGHSDDMILGTGDYGGGVDREGAILLNTHRNVGFVMHAGKFSSKQ